MMMLSSALPRVRARRATPLFAGLLGAFALLSACDNVTEPATHRSSSDAMSPTALEGPNLTLAPTVSVLTGSRGYVDPYSNAAQTASAWRLTRPADAAEMQKVAAQPQAMWIGNWNVNVTSDVNNMTTTVAATGAVPVFVAYNIPQRDCGGLSGGTSVVASQYKTWIAGFAKGIGARRAVVILEPDALAAMDCLSATDQQTRLSLLAYAVATFRNLGATSVYIDAGHPGWQSAATMASRLAKANVGNATGFSLNVSNFITDASNVTYGHQLSSLIGNKHFIIDSGRNGLGPTPDAQWCNPAGRALGTRPTTQTGIAGLDAFLWVKTPGESDGACNGGPAPGAWWPDYALGLAQRAAF